MKWHHKSTGGSMLPGSGGSFKLITEMLPVLDATMKAVKNTAASQLVILHDMLKAMNE